MLCLSRINHSRRLSVKAGFLIRCELSFVWQVGIDAMADEEIESAKVVVQNPVVGRAAYTDWAY